MLADLLPQAASSRGKQGLTGKQGLPVLMTKLPSHGPWAFVRSHLVSSQPGVKSMMDHELVSPEFVQSDTELSITTC